MCKSGSSEASKWCVWSRHRHMRRASDWRSGLGTRARAPGAQEHLRELASLPAAPPERRCSSPMCSLIGKRGQQDHVWPCASRARMHTPLGIDRHKEKESAKLRPPPLRHTKEQELRLQYLRLGAFNNSRCASLSVPCHLIPNHRHRWRCDGVFVGHGFKLEPSSENGYAHGLRAQRPSQDVVLAVFAAFVWLTVACALT